MVGSLPSCVSGWSLSLTPYFSWTRLAKIKAWIDENNPGDPLIPFSVALEERLAQLSPEDKTEEEKKIGTASGLPKITQAGYTSLDVGGQLFFLFFLKHRH